MGTARSPLTLIVTTAILVVALCDHTYAYIPAISYPSVPDGKYFKRFCNKLFYYRH